MIFAAFRHFSVDGDQDFFVAPVEFLSVVAARIEKKKNFWRKNVKKRKKKKKWGIK